MVTVFEVKELTGGLGRADSFAASRTSLLEAMQVEL